MPAARTLGIAVLEGRELTVADHADSPLVAVVNRTLAQRLWPGRPAVGRVLTFPRSGGDRTVIGVVDDVRYYGLAEAARPLAYLPLAQRFFPQAFLHARSPADTGVILQHVRQVLADLDPGAPLSDVGTLRDRVDEAFDRWRDPALLAGLLAVVTLVLTMGGLYAVLTMAVGQRTRELAIRMVLGAREGSVRWMVLSDGLRLVASGALMEKRITRAFETLNKLGETQTCAIVPEYLGLKISALRLAHEFTEKREAEKEEQRQIREQMREEQRVRREITTMRALTKRRSRAPGGSAGHPGDGVLWSPPGNGGPFEHDKPHRRRTPRRGCPGVCPRPRRSCPTIPSGAGPPSASDASAGFDLPRGAGGRGVSSVSSRHVEAAASRRSSSRPSGAADRSLSSLTIGTVGRGPGGPACVAAFVGSDFSSHPTAEGA